MPNLVLLSVPLLLTYINLDLGLMLGPNINAERLGEARNLHCLQCQSSTSYHFTARAARIQVGAFGRYQQARTV